MSNILKKMRQKFFPKKSKKPYDVYNEGVVYKNSRLTNCTLGKGSYVASGCVISMTTIGKFCSIGPNLLCGWGIHPTNGISTSPAFYSTHNQCGFTFSSVDKIAERKEIHIGNDVFIGMNVTILDGVTIGDGAIIAAGAVVVKDVAPYSVVGGAPARHIKYRFTPEQVEALLATQWWNFNDDQLQNVEKYFFDIDTFIGACSKAIK